MSDDANDGSDDDNPWWMTQEGAPLRGPRGQTNKKKQEEDSSDDDDDDDEEEFCFDEDDSSEAKPRATASSRTHQRRRHPSRAFCRPSSRPSRRRGDDADEEHVKDDEAPNAATRLSATTKKTTSQRHRRAAAAARGVISYKEASSSTDTDTESDEAEAEAEEDDVAVLPSAAAKAAAAVASKAQSSPPSSPRRFVQRKIDELLPSPSRPTTAATSAAAAAAAAAKARSPSSPTSSPSVSPRRLAQRKIKELWSPRSSTAAATMAMAATTSQMKCEEDRDHRRRRNAPRTKEKKDLAHGVGTLVYKAFPPHGTFWGQVYGTRLVRPAREDDNDDNDSDDDDDAEEVYCVAYEDGDREEMTEGEMRNAVRSASRHKPSPSTVANLAKVVQKYQRGERVKLDENYHNQKSNNSPPTAKKRHSENEEVERMDCDEEDEPNYGDTDAAEFVADAKVDVAGSDSDDSSYATGRAVPRRSASSSPPKKKVAAATTQAKATLATKATARATGGAVGAIASKKRKRPEPKKRAASSTTAKRGTSSTKRAGAGKAKNVDGDGNSDDDNDSGKVYGNDDLPVITEPQGMFDDMIHRLARDGGRPDGAVSSTFSEHLLPLLQTLSDRPLRLATMCSGTESPILALDMIQSALKRLFENDPALKHMLDEKKVASVLPMEHVFSCEIEPFKQAYIERNFHPPVLFRDIRELKNDQAHTAYGTLVDVPGLGSVDLLVAGTSCVDYSNLNTQRKTIDEGGESGQTFLGMIEWIRKAKPPVVVIENVYSAPWDEKVRLFQREGYDAAYGKFDTKRYYIPHTRQRGYLVAVRKGSKIADFESNWKSLVKSLEHPVTPCLDAFMFSNDDPRVIRGKARLLAESLSGGREGKTGRIDWAKCETRHHIARSKEELGEGKPLTNWSESGSTAMPSFASNEWMDKQVNRIHDLTDINLLRMAKDGMDATHKTMVWNLSQNCDRDTMGKLGLCSCLTPSGVPYIPNRGAPLVGEELLLLQGIPADDLILTKESEDNLKDLAGNAMSTTVVGAVTLCALLVSFKALHQERCSVSTQIVPSIVPRPLNPPSKVSIVDNLGKYVEEEFELTPQPFQSRNEWAQFLEEAASSSRMCTNEGVEEVLPLTKLMVCLDCGKTESRDAALPPRPFERHKFVDFDDAAIRVRRTEPSRFRSSFAKRLPTLVRFGDLHCAWMPKPDSINDDMHWESWTALVKSLCSGADESSVFRLARFQRSIYWSAHYTASNGSRMECRIKDDVVTWLVFLACPKGSPIKLFLDRPLARLTVKPRGTDDQSFTLLDGEWEVCLPVISFMSLSIEGSGEILKSWRNRLGLKGGYENEEQYQVLDISVETMSIPDPLLQKRVEGSYSLLPDCGGACGSLRKKITNPSSHEAPLFLFLESGRIRAPADDRFVLAAACHRTAFGEYRDVILEIDPRYRPVFTDRGQSKESVRATVYGQWTKEIHLNLKPSIERCSRVCPAADTALSVSIHDKAWRDCPLVTSCRFPSWSSDDVFRQCTIYPELNLQKSSRVFESAFFATSRLPLPLSRTWMALDRSETETDTDGDDVVCRACSPLKPPIMFQRVRRKGRLEYIPVEDVAQAGVYERRLKQRPQPWVIRFAPTSDNSSNSLTASIGCNPVSLCQRAVGHFPLQSAARRCALTRKSRNQIQYDWRIVEHTERTDNNFGKLTFTSNKSDKSAKQPPNFILRLRTEQLRSLCWMLCQEAATEPYFEEEVEEAILPSLNWRAEGRARRPVLVRGGILADEVGYGKTALALALVDAAPQVSLESPSPRLLRTNATLIIVPPHLSGQWPAEVTKFLGEGKAVVQLESLSSLNSVSVKDMQDADIVIANFTLLSNDKYFSRLATLCGVDSSLVGNDSKGRRFENLYAACVQEMPLVVESIRQSCSKAHKFIKDRAKENTDNNDETSWVESKKAAYKKPSAAGRARRQVDCSEDDPWGLKSCRDYRTIKCPPLEMFSWNRVIVDEFTYLNDSKNCRVLQVVKQLNSNFRWCLSGTPPHQNFNDVSCLADLMGIHLGVEEQLPGVKLSMPLGGTRNYAGFENMSKYMEIRSLQWHERRHELAQAFLDRFVRQNVAEIDEIPYEEHEYCLPLPPAERAIYLELDTHLKALGMDSKHAIKSKKASTGDRYNRMQSVLKGSATGDEALLKYCCHFNYDAKAMDALRTIDELIRHRETQKVETEVEIVNSLKDAFRQRNSVLELQPDWVSTTTEHGEVADTLAIYLKDVDSFASVTHGADQDIHQNLQKLVAKAKREVSKGTPTSNSARRTDDVDSSDDDDDEKVAENRKTKKRKPSNESPTILYDMKFALREHMHKVRSLGKELCGRTRSLRYVKQIRNFRAGDEAPFTCPSCSQSALTLRDAAILSICGHVGCLPCIRACASDSRCNHAHCAAHVNIHHIVSSQTLGLDDGNWVEGGMYGHKLTTIVRKAKEIVDGGKDRLIVFCQFDDLIAKVMDALKDAAVDVLTLTGTVTQMVKAVSVFQKEKPSKSDPRLLLLKMDDEQSAGLNLTGLNHAIFVHPLLANSQVEYDAYETQAIGRIRRYGQAKTVHVWRYFANHTIDTDIKAKFQRK